jgi:hypothetical protein
MSIGLLAFPAGRRPILGFLVGLVVGLGLLTGPATASGAVTIGSDLTAPDFVASDPPCEFDTGCGGIQQAIPGRVTAAPFDGVIVRWRARAQGLTRLQVARYTGEDTAILTAISAPVYMSSLSTNNVSPTRLPIGEGEYLGMRLVEDGQFGVAYPRNGADIDAFDAGLSTTTPTTSPDPDIPAEAALNADIERDADGDGYGDETQDECPTLASVQGPCPPQAAPPAEDADAPSFTRKPRARPRAFRLGSRGTLISFRLSESATVRLTVLRRRAGRTSVASRCAPANHQDDAQGRCVRYVRMGSMERAAEAGTNRFRWRGRIGKRTASPGRYRVLITARDAAGNRSRAKVGLWVLPPRQNGSDTRPEKG